MAALILLLRSGAGAAEIRVISAAEGIPAGPITSLLVSGGRLYAGSEERGLADVDLGSGKAFLHTRAEGLPSDGVKSLALFRGKLHVGTAEGIAVREGAAWTVLRQADGVLLRNVVLGVQDNRELWAGAVHLKGGLVRFDGKAWKFMGGEGRGLFNSVNSFAFFRGGFLMGAFSGAVYVRRGEDVEPLLAGFPGANVFSVAERGGTFYAGTSKGLHAWRGGRWNEVTVPDPFRGKAVFSLLRSELDLVAGGMAGVLVMDGKGNQDVLSGKEGLPPGAVTALAEADGTLYAATENGVAVVKGWRR